MFYFKMIYHNLRLFCIYVKRKNMKLQKFFYLTIKVQLAQLLVILATQNCFDQCQLTVCVNKWFYLLNLKASSQF